MSHRNFLGSIFFPTRPLVEHIVRLDVDGMSLWCSSAAVPTEGQLEKRASLQTAGKEGRIADS